MFYHIEGTVTDILNQLAVVDCGGVGYALNTTANTISRLTIGEKAKLYTYLHVREESFELFGFYTLSEKKSFEMLIGVSGVGPKAALSILSSSTPEALAMAIIAGDEKALTVAQGIGKKIAQRIILELKDKMTKESAATISGGGGFVQPGPVAGGGKANDAAAALAVLGYSVQEIAAAMKGVDIESNTLEDIIRLALKNMMK